MYVCMFDVMCNAHLNAIAIGTMLVDIAAQSVGVEAVLECVQDIAASGSLRAWHDEQDDGHEKDNYRC